jgi:hypothetical protein
MKALILILASSFLPTPAHAGPPPFRLPAQPLAPSPTAAPRIECQRPRTLFLRRFEDASAWLECGGRVLVRVSVPG